MSEQPLFNIKKHPWRWLLVGAFVSTFLLGGYGYFQLLSCETTGPELWLNVFYKSIGLFFHGGEVADRGLVLAVARVMATLVTTWAIAWTAMAFLNREIRQWWLIRNAKDHFVICGLGDRGFALSTDLLAKHTVIAIEATSSNPNIERLRKLGGVVIEGDARDAKTLSSAALTRASHLVVLTESDATNLEILNVLRDGFRKKGLRCHIHIHLSNRENHVLFEAGGRYFPPLSEGMEISLINLRESAAQVLFQQHVLGENTDTTTPGAKPVKLLINGFGQMGEAILIEAMLTGHFCNHVPIEITVLDKDAETRKEAFFRRYWEVKNNLADDANRSTGLGLWKLEFMERLEDAGPLERYTDILACHDSEDDALVAIHNLWERHHCDADDSSGTRFFAHAPSGRELANKDIYPFGSKLKICCKEFVIDKKLDELSRRTHEIYARKRLEALASQEPGAKEILGQLQKGQITLNQALRRHDASQRDQSKLLAWENLSLFLKASNKAEIRHFGIKLRALGLHEVRKWSLPIGADISEYPWPKLKELEEIDDTLPSYAYQLLSQAQQATGLSIEGLKARIDALAESEHTRWNAYLVLNNYRYGERKDEARRIHDCLLSWEELKRSKPEMLVYDYKNVYQIAKVLEAVGEYVEPINQQK
jgi:hypothetical protein